VHALEILVSMASRELERELTVAFERAFEAELRARGVVLNSSRNSER